MSDVRPFIGYLDEQQYSRFRGISVRSVRNERARKAGPPYIRAGRKVFYPVAGVRAWMQARQLHLGRMAD